MQSTGFEGDAYLCELHECNSQCSGWLSHNMDPSGQATVQAQSNRTAPPLACWPSNRANFLDIEVHKPWEVYL